MKGPDGSFFIQGGIIMKSDDMFDSIVERTLEITGDVVFSQAGVKISIEKASPLEWARAFLTALYDYSADKLPVTPANAVAVDELPFYFARFDELFTTESEKEEFYANYVSCILWGYGNLKGIEPKWTEIDDTVAGEYPQIIGETLVTKKSTSSEEAALWLFGEYKKQLKQLQEKEEPPKQHKKSRWGIFGK